MLLERITEIEATQPSVAEGYAPDANIAEAVKLLPAHLQPVVTLMATMVSPSEESMMREKMGQKALAQATSTSLMVRTLFKFAK